MENNPRGNSSDKGAITPSEARVWLTKLYRLASGQVKIASTEENLKIRIFDAFEDDDLVVIFAEEARRS